MKYSAVRAFALSLPEASEQPHHNFSSFRVRGKIFVTVPPEREHLHVFVDEQDRALALAAHPKFVERLLWGGKVVGLRITLARATESVVKALVRQAYDHKSAKPAKRMGGKR